MLTMIRKRWQIFLIVGAGLILRIPFRSEVLFNWDSVNFALGIQGFDIVGHRPHPPGNILYIYLARLLTYFTHDENLSMVSMSIAGGILSAIILYWFAQHIHNKTDALFSALLLLTSPVAWLYDEVALTYSLEMMFSVAIAYTCYKALEGETSFAYLSAFLLSVAGGFRPSSLLVFGPLFLFVLLKTPKKHALFCLVGSLALCSAWGILLIRDSGGLGTLLTATKNLSMLLDPPSTTAILHPLFQAGHIGILLVAFYWMGIIALPRRNAPNWERTFFNIWLIPGILIMILYHMGQSGYILFLLPALFLFTPQLMRGLLERLTPNNPSDEAKSERSIQQKMYMNMAVMPIMGIIIFYLTSLPVISGVNACWRQAKEQLGTIDSSRMMVITNNSKYRDFLGFRNVEFYLPHLRTYYFSAAFPNDVLFNPGGIRYVGWKYMAFNKEDNYRRGPEEDRKQLLIKFWDGLEGILFTDPDMAAFVKTGDKTNNEKLQIEQFGCFYYVRLPQNTKELRVEEGQLVLY